VSGNSKREEGEGETNGIREFGISGKSFSKSKIYIKLKILKVGFQLFELLHLLLASTFFDRTLRHNPTGVPGHLTQFGINE